MLRIDHAEAADDVADGSLHFLGRGRQCGRKVCLGREHVVNEIALPEDGGDEFIKKGGRAQAQFREKTWFASPWSVHFRRRESG